MGVDAARHRTTVEIEAGLAHVLDAPADGGTVQMIVARPAVGERTVVADAVLDTAVGLVGDCWLHRGSSTGVDGAAHPDRQVTLMNARFADLVAGSRDRWPLAGDQLYVDLDIGEENLPPGTRLEIGNAVVEISASLHTGCAKFVDRYGSDAGRFVNVGVGRTMRLRGVNAFVIEGGTVATDDLVRKGPPG